MLVTVAAAAGLSFGKKCRFWARIYCNSPISHQTVPNIATKFLLLALAVLSISATPIPAGSTVQVVVIDPGHGGFDPGTRGRSVLEKNVALKISLKLGAYIERNFPQVKVIYTRKDDRYLELNERAEIANQAKADLFICIHANSVPRPDVHGTETFVMGLHRSEQNFEVSKRENSVMLLDEKYKEKYEGFDPSSPESYILFSLTQSAFQESSLKFAGLVEQQFRTKLGRYSHGVKQAGFWVLWKTTMPSVLIETGFLTNAKDEAYLGSAEGQDAMAAGIFRAFREYKTQLEAINQVK